MKHFPWVPVLAVAACVLFCLWLYSATEWVEVEIDTPAKGEALTNRTYAVEQMARRMGVKLVRAKGLETLPPSTATLWLRQPPNNLLVENRARVKQWVEQGGHLLVSGGWLDSDIKSEMGDWPPLELHQMPEIKGDPRKDLDAELPKGARCSQLSHVVGASTVFSDADAPFAFCGWNDVQDQYLSSVAPVVWSVGSVAGPQAMRVQAGRGLVTVSLIDGHWTNENLFNGDNAALVVATGALRRGAEVWIVDEDEREALLPWLWHQGDAVVLIFALALAVWLWQVSARLGSVRKPARVQRRSIAEQLAGTAQYLRRTGRSTLHAAQLRALTDVAQRRFPRYRDMTAAQKVQSLAQATGCDSAALTQAMQLAQFQDVPVWQESCALLERVRRALLQPQPS